MDAERRRKAILRILEHAEGPQSATTLATKCSVSRQIIVGDIALLRASGADITATPKGYVVSPEAPQGLTTTIACIHAPEDMGRELYTIVDCGAEVVDVVVEHPVYGEIRGPLRLRSRYDVDEFLERVARAEAKPLSALTGGIHLHTVACADKSVLLRVLIALKKEGFLLPVDR